MCLTQPQYWRRSFKDHLGISICLYCMKEVRHPHFSFPCLHTSVRICITRRDLGAHRLYVGREWSPFSAPRSRLAICSLGVETPLPRLRTMITSYVQIWYQDISRRVSCYTLKLGRRMEKRHCWNCDAASTANNSRKLDGRKGEMVGQQRSYRFQRSKLAE